MPKIKDLSTHYTRPDWVRRINAMGDSIGGPQNLIPLNPEALIDGAIASTGGLDDFGSFDGNWRPHPSFNLKVDIESRGGLS